MTAKMTNVDWQGYLTELSLIREKLRIANLTETHNRCNRAGSLLANETDPATAGDLLAAISRELKEVVAAERARVEEAASRLQALAANLLKFDGVDSTS